MKAGALGATRIQRLHHAGALKLIFPKTHRPDLEATLVNTGGGLTGGDRFSLISHVAEGAHLSLTTQAAERAYRAQPAERARLRTEISVAANATLFWLPQELILYDHAALDRRLEITLAPEARLLMVEPMVFGRAAMGETVRHLHFTDRITIRRGGEPLYCDGVDIHGDAHRILNGPATARRARAMASVVIVAPQAATHLTALRALLPATGGASMLARDVLVMRLLAADSFELRRSLIPILDRLTDNRLPLSWRL
ncbi:MAG: urease accessory protein UreD [Pseudomonadota bacterium]